MASWNRHHSVYVNPPRREDTIGDRYLKLLEAPRNSDLMAAQAYFIGKDPDRKEALQIGLRMTHDPDPALRRAGVIILARLHEDGSRDAERALTSMCNDPASSVRTSIAKELTFGPSPETGRILAILSRDEDPLVRVQTANALFYCEDPEARGELLRLVKDPADSVRAEATSSLGWADGDEIDIHPFLYLTGDPYPEVRANMADWFGWLKSPSFLLSLIELSHDPSTLVRARAIRALDGYDLPEAQERISQAILDPEDAVRLNAMISISKRQSPEAIQTLLDHAKDDCREIRKVVAQSIEGRVTPDMLPILECLSEDAENAITRRAAARCIGDIPGEEAEQVLVRLLHDPSQAVAKATKKILERRARLSSIEKPTEFELRYGRQESVATRIAFHGKSSVPLKAWEQFLGNIQRLDGLATANSDTSPAIQVEAKDGAHYCVIPFGPAHWMRLEFRPQPPNPPRMSFAILRTHEISEWSSGLAGIRVTKGKKLALRLGWFST